jgi:hypothetical protein
VVLWNTYKRICVELSDEDRAWAFEKTARHVYQI